MYKLLQAYVGIDGIRKQLISFAEDKDCSYHDLFVQVAELLYGAEMQMHLVAQNEDTLLDVSEFDDTASELYSWCNHGNDECDVGSTNSDSSVIKMVNTNYGKGEKE